MQANERGEQLHRLSDSYTQLKSDFEYNVQLLDGRDSELAKRDAQLAHHEIKLEEQLALHEHQQQELAAANEGPLLKLPSTLTDILRLSQGYRHLALLIRSSFKWRNPVCEGDSAKAQEIPRHRHHAAFQGRFCNNKGI